MEPSIQFRVELQNSQEFIDALYRFPGDLDRAIYEALNETMSKILTRAKQNAPVDTGRLRADIKAKVKKKELNGVIWNDVNYACVYNARTNVKTEKGFKIISKISIEDKVLTQDGKYHQVIAISRIDATEKPKLIDIEVYWRKDKNHKITLTEDHKVLAKINGAYTWLEARKLKEGMIVMTPKKKAHNKGIGKKYIKKICSNCGKEYQGQARLYCSLDCRNDVYRKNHPQIGHKRSKEATANIRKANIKFLKENPGKHPNRIMAKNGKKTSCEKEVKEWLESLKIRYKEEEEIGNYFVDFYCPDLNIVFEADGAYWHKDQKKDIKRDLSIKRKLAGVKIIHIHFADKRFSKSINNNPVKDVYYIQVNPSMNSYVDLETFKEAKIIKINKWKYKKRKSTAGLYDLSVEGAHSFVANGILISNCYVHEGHKTKSKYIERAIYNNQKAVQDRMQRKLELLTKRGLI